MTGAEGAVSASPRQPLREIDGDALLAGLRASLAWLQANQEQVNELNVFPVPDGDTGSNMYLTLRSAVEDAQAAPVPSSAGSVMRAAAHGSLMGARGNSGVILSQIFRGFAQGVADRDRLDAAGVAACLSEGARVAYKAVMKPTEGTILTVVREAAEAAQRAAAANFDIRAVLDETVREAHSAVERTIDQLAVLREAGVVDAGGFGLAVIFEGLTRAVGEADGRPAGPAGARAPQWRAPGATAGRSRGDAPGGCGGPGHHRVTGCRSSRGGPAAGCGCGRAPGAGLGLLHRVHDQRPRAGRGSPARGAGRARRVQPGGRRRRPGPGSHPHRRPRRAHRRGRPARRPLQPQGRGHDGSAPRDPGPRRPDRDGCGGTGRARRPRRGGDPVDRPAGGIRDAGGVRPDRVARGLRGSRPARLGGGAGGHHRGAGTLRCGGEPAVRGGGGRARGGTSGDLPEPRGRRRGRGRSDHEPLDPGPPLGCQGDRGEPRW